MKISKNYGEIDWLNDFSIPKKATVQTEEISVVAEVSPLKPEAVDDTVLAFECDKIEKCASTNTPYFYNKTWNTEHVTSLKEYALACGLDTKMIKAAEYKELAKEERIVTASASVAVPEVKTETKETKTAFKIDLGDPFHIEDRSNTDHMNKKDWQVNTSSQKLQMGPVMTGGIIPVRGGENYLLHNTQKLATNQNSIANPKVIEELVNSDKLDTGARLAQEREAKATQKIAEKKQWEQDVIDAMPHRAIVAHGKVFPTEALNAQPGLASPASQRIVNNYNPDNVADKTVGEQLKEKNQVRADSIRRPKEENKWEEDKKADLKASVRGISDGFTESLKKALGK